MVRVRLALVVTLALWATSVSADRGPWWVLGRAVAGIPPQVIITSSDTIQTIVDAHPAGTSYLLQAGTYSMQTVAPKAGDIYTAAAGAIMTGARTLTSFAHSAPYWIASGQTQQGTTAGQCQDGHGGCIYPEQLWIDDVLLEHVTTLGAVVAGTSWFFDYGANQIYIADNPSGHTVETSVTTLAFSASADNVTITGMTVQKYANLAQSGAIGAGGATGWVITSNIVRSNHGLGIRSGPSASVVGNNVHHNGQLGISGSTGAQTIDSNEIAYNNTAYFDPGWEAGGTKWTETDGLIVRGNFSHHNDGPGLWTDINNINTIYENNIVEDNIDAGIFHEISYAAIIRNNSVSRNGLTFTNYLFGGGIVVAASPDVEIYGNTVTANRHGIVAIQQNRTADPATHGPHEISNLSVHDNSTSGTVLTTAGLAQDIGNLSYFTPSSCSAAASRNNRWQHNTYSGTPLFTYCNTADISFATWQGYSQDTTGSVATLLTPTMNLAYLGAFRGPSGLDLSFCQCGLAFDAAGNSGAGSLYVATQNKNTVSTGVANWGGVAEITLPTPVVSGTLGSLNRAATIQGDTDATQGQLFLTRNGAATTTSIEGLKVVSSSLYINTATFYDPGGVQNKSFFKRNKNLSTAGSLLGPYGPTNGLARPQGGYLADISSAWQSRLGGDTITGLWSENTIESISSGYSALSLTIANITGAYQPTSLLFYPPNHAAGPTYGVIMDGDIDLVWTPATTGGSTAVMPVGYDTVLFFGGLGTGGWCYGEGTTNPALNGMPVPGEPGVIYCYDPENLAKGGHAYPAKGYYWAYNLFDLLYVKTGAFAEYAPRPYAYGNIIDLIPTFDGFYAGQPGFRGAAYDSVHEKIYLAAQKQDGAGPVFHVLQVTH